MTDEELIKRTLRLARKGRGRVSPNPMVGAILVKDNRILAQGYHKLFGGAHAEVEALDALKGEATGSTLYVNLEPCCHHGKQPPCVDAIVKSGIKKVVIGTQDPNPAVAGKGIQHLRDQGIEVQVGVAEDACKELNEAYFKHIVTQFPFVTAKIAQTLDGRIAASNGKAQWITSEASRRLGHKMRAEHDAILVGIGTVLADDPQLTVRLAKGHDPKRIVVDSTLRIPLESTLLSDSVVNKTIVATTGRASKKRITQVVDKGAAVWIVDADADGHVDLRLLLKRMGREGIASVLVEGGSQINSALIKQRLVDKVAVFVAPKILGSGLNALQNLGIDSLEQSIQLHDLRKRQVGEDILLLGRISLN